VDSPPHFEVKKTPEDNRPRSPKSPRTLDQPSSPKRSLIEERKLLKSSTKDPLRSSTEKPATFKPDYHHLSTKEIIIFLNSNTQQQQQQQQTSPKINSPKAQPQKTPPDSETPPERARGAQTAHRAEHAQPQHLDREQQRLNADERERA
jgi:hypothetical protein